MDWAMKTKGYNQKRACALAGIDLRVYRRTSKRLADTELRARMKELASERRRFGYRRLHILLKREGWDVNWKTLYRLYREKGLTVGKRDGRKRAVGTRTPMVIPKGPNQRWSLDFMSDALEDGRRFRGMSSTTSVGNAWLRWWIRPLVACVSPESWIVSLNCAAIPALWSATMEPN